MSVSFFIARRYLSAKRKKNVINLITRISVIGIAAITAAMIILLTAFNGIEMMIENLYSEFDSDITIHIAEGKSFNENRIDVEKLKSIDEIVSLSRAIEEVIILKHENKWINASMLGVDSSFLVMSKLAQHMVDGEPFLEKENKSYGLIGATLLDKLGGYIPEYGSESLICYVPKRKIKIRLGRSPFKSQLVPVSGRVNYNKEVNASSFIIPIDLAKDFLDYSNQISAYYIDCEDDCNKEEVKAKVQNLIGLDFVVKTSYEKNELIYQTSKSEKVIVMIILLFIFVLAAFNLVASLTMLFVEKLDNIKTMVAFGANRRFLFNIFFYEGLLIAVKGILFGLLFGYLVCFLQIEFELVTMPNSGGEAFPMRISYKDGALIVFMVSVLSVLLSYLPVKYLIRRNILSIVK
ncbi:MAG: ABC transporter permease [Flavobacteriales bacterium]